MHDDLLGRLACPDCRTALVVERRAPDGTAASLRCTGCGRLAVVRGGIPRLLPIHDVGPAQVRTAEHFTSEFTAAAEGDLDLGEDDLNRWVLFTRTGLDPTVLSWRPHDWYPTSLPPEAPRGTGDALAGQWVLDAGSGPGRLARVAAPEAARVVGLEFGDHVERGPTVCSGLTNTDFVQGSALAPPFADCSFDVVYSVGVLQFTPDARAAVQALARLVAPGGRMSVWVYPPEYWGRGVRGAANRAVNRWLSAQDPARARRSATRILYPLGQLQARVAKHRWLKLLLAPLFLVGVPRHPQREVMLATILDKFGPAGFSLHTPEEVAGWFSQAGFEDVQMLPVRTSVTGRRPPAGAGAA